MARIHVEKCAQMSGERVELAGWVDVRRDHGKLIFIDLRDESGIVQMVFTPKNADLHARADTLRPEWVIRVFGTVKSRPEGMQNLEIATGKVEIEVEKLEVLNEAETSPFEIIGDGRDINEDIRLEYRYIDLRRERLQKNLRFRSEVAKRIRDFLNSKKFVEIETPLLTKSTPEGSRDFLVPSRMQPGSFYALPQSPQQYKQLLMMAGFEKYYQLSRALRDEDLRANRTFEHTQLDLEMSYVSRDELMQFIEELIINIVESCGLKVKEKPFPRVSYKDALQKYGADKFDLRSEDDKKENVQAFAWVIDFPLFEKTDDGWTYSHNPFTGPRKEDEVLLREGKNIGEIISEQCDLVCNGDELAGGGIRINKPDLLEKVFEIIGHSRENIEEQFGHMLRAMRFGAPPEGGVGLGFDRLVMTLLGEENLREIQAFPTTSGGRTAVMKAPSPVSHEQLSELGLEIKKKK